MLRTWNYVKKRQHDASGILNPADWEWEKNERINIYYPVIKIR